MKDLYTFDSNKEKALETYETVRRAYSAFFDEFKIPYLVAEADSGDIGGNLSHEYQIPSQKGEDNVINCTLCSYVANEEMAISAKTTAKNTLSKPLEQPGRTSSNDDLIQKADPAGDIFFLRNYPYKRWTGISKDRATVFRAIYPAEIENPALPGESARETQPNLNVFRRVFEGLDLSVENCVEEDKNRQEHVYRLYFDHRLPQTFIDEYLAENSSSGSISPINAADEHNTTRRLKEHTFDLVKIQAGDACPKCPSGTLQIQRAVELGHTFHLGTRYSLPLHGTFAIATSPTSADKYDKSSRPTTSNTEKEAYLEMGCHGIGVSRLIATVADILSDPQGLNWPRCIAPFEVIVIPTARDLQAEAVAIYDLLSFSSPPSSSTPSSSKFNERGWGYDALLDDRLNRETGWKLKDADLIGYPVIVVLGKTWRMSGGLEVEVQCRRLGIKQAVKVKLLEVFVGEILERL